MPFRKTIPCLASAALLLPLVSPTAAHAAPTTGPATAWAAFAKPDPWVDQADNLHWYVATPVIDKAALGKAITLSVTSPRSIDCANLGAGYQGAGDWTAAPIRIRSCGATRAVVDLTPTSAMVGARVTLTGWSAVGNRTSATIKGTVRLGGVTRAASSTATRATAPKPVGPLVRIGSWQGKPVHSSSLNGINEIWVGKGARAVRFVAPDGDAWHVGMTGSRVDVWTMEGTTPVGWHLDLATGKVTTQKLPSGAVTKQGVPGFWLAYDGRTAGTTGDESALFDWSGTRYFTVTMFAARPGRNLGFTTTHAVGVRGGQSPAEIVFFPLDGTDMQVVRLPGTPWITGGVVDATGVTVSHLQAGESGTKTCRLEPGWTVCQPV